MGGEGTRGYKCGGRRGGLIERKSKDTIKRWLELEGFRRFFTLALPPLRQGGHTPAIIFSGLACSLASNARSKSTCSAILSKLYENSLLWSFVRF